jgi:plasmid stabilization system protein ParE
MAYVVNSTDRFELSVQRTMLWLIEVWSNQSAEKFALRLKSVIDQISQNPNIGRPAAKENIRSFFVTRHNRIYYRVKGNVITLLLLFETKQHPQKNKYE